MLTISPFSKAFDRESFYCGEPLLDSYLKRQVSQDVRNKIASCFILHNKGETSVLGYYTLSTLSVEAQNIPDSLRKKLSRYPHILMVLLGRVAISEESKGQKLGELLLIDACKRSLIATDSIGAWALAVDPLHDQARAFYSKYGFINLSCDKMFLTMKDIKANLN